MPFILDLERNNLLISENNTIIANTQRPLVLHCPFDSHPPANITWIVNKTQIFVYNYANGPHENRRVKGLIYMLKHIAFSNNITITTCLAITTSNKIELNAITGIISYTTEACSSLMYARRTLDVTVAMLRITLRRKTFAATDML